MFKEDALQENVMHHLKQSDSFSVTLIYLSGSIFCDYGAKFSDPQLHIRDELV